MGLIGIKRGLEAEWANMDIIDGDVLYHEAKCQQAL